VPTPPRKDEKIMNENASAAPHAPVAPARTVT